jgi:hypothetical protein
VSSSEVVVDLTEAEGGVAEGAKLDLGYKGV